MDTELWRQNTHRVEGMRNAYRSWLGTSKKEIIWDTSVFLRDIFKFVVEKKDVIKWAGFTSLNIRSSVMQLCLQ